MKYPALLFLSAAITAGAQPDAAESAKVVQEMQAWLKLPRDKRPAIPDAAAKAALTRADAATLTKAFWEDRVEALKVERLEEMKAKLITHGERRMKFEVLKFGDKSAKNVPLFISMHGGGNDPSPGHRINESQWENQIKLGMAYKPASGYYIAPRAPTDTWNLWHEAHIDPMFERIIQNMVALEGVDPNKVYFMGYSAGGDGVYQLAPRMADRLAAASMMAGHPNETSPLSLRNLPFTIHVGAEDGGFNRNKVALEFGKKLEELQKADPKGYVHWVHLHEGRSHWMNLEDKEAIPWMEKHTRNPIPEKVVWYQDDVTHAQFYWLAVPAAEAKGKQQIIAERSGQNITVTAKDNAHVTVLLNDSVADMDQPVTVTWNGKTLEPRRVDRTVAVIRRTLEERGDPFLTFSGEITLPPQ